jgi:chorismate lyase / 3-hydroxybenzoate synthase
MSVSTSPRAKQQSRTQKRMLDVPPWTCRLIGQQPQTYSTGSFEIAVHEGEIASLVSLVIPHARQLTAADFEQKTVEAYQQIQTIVSKLSHKHPVRFWNMLPDIHQQLDAGRDRYMVFNTGRFRAFTEWFGRPADFASRLPAASAVGSDGDALSIHCLSMNQPGTALENPRQISAFNYSSQYGPQPPCFARATIVNQPTPTLIAAGTASIVGEQSLHADHLNQQMDETIENLCMLIVRALGRDEGRAAIKRFTDIRIYYPRKNDKAIIQNTFRKLLSPSTSLEMMHAQLCRSNLLVEVEGIATLEAMP